MSKKFIKEIEDALITGEGLKEVFDNYRNDPDFTCFLEEARSTMIQITLLKPDGSSETQTMSRYGISFTGISPAYYQIKLSTGWVIWEGELAEDELILSNEESLPLAADTAEENESKKIRQLLDGELNLETIAGLEFGTIRLHYVN